MIGGLIVIFGFIIIVMVHEGGHLLAAKAFGIKATKYFLGFGPTIWSFKKGETEYGIKAIPAGGYVSIIGMSPVEEVSEEDEPRAYRSRPFHQKVIVVMSGIVTHFIIAFILIWCVKVVIGEPDFSSPTMEVSRVVVETSDGIKSPAFEAGLIEGDRILSVQGFTLYSWEEFTEILRSNPNSDVSIILDRQGEILSIETTLQSRFDANGQVEIGFLGVSPKFENIRQNPFIGVPLALSEVWFITKQSIRGLWEFVSNFSNFIGAIWGDDDILDEIRPVSIIGIVQFGAATQEAGLNMTLRLVAYLSIFVGLVNAIPLYPLDGGHFAVAVYEKITGRPPDIRKLLPIAAIVISFIVILGVLGVYFDIMRPVTF
jgi:membrane-associated protease RseP (regulator of RpoE activity)